MDAAGWISVPLIASFNRIKNLTSDLSIVVETMRMTPVLEVSPKGRFVRLAQTWPEWLLPNAQKNDDVEKDFEEARAEVKALHERKEKERTSSLSSSSAKDVAPDADGAAEPAVERDEPAVADKKDDAAAEAPADKVDEPEASTAAAPAPADAEPAPAAVEVNGEKDADAAPTEESTVEAPQSEEATPAAAKKDAPSAPRKESLSPREGASRSRRTLVVSCCLADSSSPRRARSPPDHLAQGDAGPADPRHGVRLDHEHDAVVVCMSHPCSPSSPFASPSPSFTLPSSSRPSSNRSRLSSSRVHLHCASPVPLRIHPLSLPATSLSLSLLSLSLALCRSPSSFSQLPLSSQILPRKASGFLRTASRPCEEPSRESVS